MKLDAQEYWTARFKDNVNFNTTGYLGMGEAYNRWLYRAYASVLTQLLQEYDVPFSQDTTVVDAGAGAGFLEELARDRGIKRVVGLDFTTPSIQHLQDRFPDYSFIHCDLTQPSLPKEIASADVVFCLSVIYHIVTEEGFGKTIKNLSRLTKRGGYLIIADNFMPLKTAYIEGVHQRDWSLTEYEEQFRKNGLEVLGYKAIFFLMNAPLRYQHRKLGRLFLNAWSWIQRQVAGSPRREKLFGFLTFYFDRIFSKIFPIGPGSHYAILRKTTDS